MKIEGSLRKNKRESTEGHVGVAGGCNESKRKREDKLMKIYTIRSMEKGKWFSEWHTHEVNRVKSEAGRKVKEGRNGHQLMLSPLKGRSPHTDLLDQQH